VNRRYELYREQEAAEGEVGEDAQRKMNVDDVDPFPPNQPRKLVHDDGKQSEGRYGSKDGTVSGKGQSQAKPEIPKPPLGLFFREKNRPAARTEERDAVPASLEIFGEIAYDGSDSTPLLVPRDDDQDVHGQTVE
jgi:hypothetical protein